MLERSADRQAWGIREQFIFNRVKRKRRKNETTEMQATEDSAPRDGVKPGKPAKVRTYEFT